MKKLSIVIIIALVVFIGFYWNAANERQEFGMGESYYGTLRSQAYELVNSEEFDILAFKEFLNSLPKYRLANWPKEFWYSITFSDPRGDIVRYQDVAMALALGVDRLWQEEDPYSAWNGW